MTAPNEPSPNGSLNPGDFNDFQAMTSEDVETSLKAGAKVSYGNAHGTHGTEVRSRIDGAYDAIDVVEGHADLAVTTSEAAANAAAVAEVTAAAAFQAAAYWETECVVSTAAVTLGVNELLIGLVQNVPPGLNRLITDLHVALLSQPNGLTFELRKWNATNTVSTVLDTLTMAAGVNRASWSWPLGLPVEHRERLYWNVTSITGSVAPQVFQPLVFGVFEIPEIP
ncbi:hypothetical protein ACFWU5_16145 [Nocardia sp. NPDC058640]|uniref:hypothetical protein n=1 Tax=Nocardia sp. NPDC058640 TaxID=3346571 RepID=UPI0036668FAA